MGGTRYGIWGWIAGIVIGFFFFPPFGIIIGPIIGAYGGEIIGGKKPDLALKAATGVLLGFFVKHTVKSCSIPGAGLLFCGECVFYSSMMKER